MRSFDFCFCSNSLFHQLDVLFGNLLEMVEFQLEFLKTLEDGTRLVPDLEKLERVDQFKVHPLLTNPHITDLKHLLTHV